MSTLTKARETAEHRRLGALGVDGLARGAVSGGTESWLSICFFFFNVTFGEALCHSVP